MGKVHFDFNKPEDARKFLFGLKAADGRKISGFRREADKEGELTDFATLSDEEAMNVASELYEGWYQLGAVTWEPEIFQ